MATATKLDLPATLRAMGVTMQTMRGVPRDDWPDSDAWVCRIDYKGRSMLVPYFGQGKGHRKIPRHDPGGPAVPVAPAVARVIACLVSDAMMGRLTFEEHCSELGVDPDSRREHATWLQCVQVAADLAALLGDDLATVEDASRDY